MGAIFLIALLYKDRTYLEPLGPASLPTLNFEETSLPLLRRDLE